MASIIFNHRVKDYANWKTYFDKDSDRRTSAGLKLIKVGEKSDDPNNVYVIMETEDISALDKMMNDPNMKEIMEEAGVVSAPEVVVIP